MPADAHISFAQKLPWTNTTICTSSTANTALSRGAGHEQGFTSEQGSWWPASCPAHGLMFPPNSKGSSASSATATFQKGSSVRERPCSPSLECGRGKLLWLFSLKQRKHIQKRKQMVLLKLFTFIFIPSCYY